MTRLADRRQAVKDPQGLTPLDRAWERVLNREQTGPQALAQACQEAGFEPSAPAPQPVVQEIIDQDDYWTPAGWSGIWKPVKQ